VANSKPKSQDADTIAVAAVLELTESEPVKVEDLVAGPKLRKAFKDAMKRAKAKKR
jgi:hypothetical protein